MLNQVHPSPLTKRADTPASVFLVRVPYNPSLPQLLQDRFIPVQPLEGHEVRPARVGHVREVDLSARELPHEPRIHRPEQSVTAGDQFRVGTRERDGGARQMWVLR